MRQLRKDVIFVPFKICETASFNTVIFQFEWQNQHIFWNSTSGKIWKIDLKTCQRLFKLKQCIPTDVIQRTKWKLVTENQFGICCKKRIVPVWASITYLRKFCQKSFNSVCTSMITTQLYPWNKHYEGRVVKVGLKRESASCRCKLLLR